MAKTEESNGRRSLLSIREVIAQARLKDWDASAAKAGKDLQGLLGAEGRGTGMVQEVGQGAGRFQQAVLQMVRRREDQHRPQRHRPPPEDLAQEQTGADLGRRRRRSCTHLLLLRAEPRGQQFANVLKAMGVKKGDRVTIYMGRVPEIVIAMLACAKIGAIHSVVYGGFSVEALQGRIEDSQSKLVITCDGGYHERQDRRAQDASWTRRSSAAHRWRT